MMKLIFALTLSCLPALAFAANNCEEIKSQIEAKIKNVGVSMYKLQIVDASAEVDGKVVGTCDGGKKKIVYLRL